MTIQTKNVGKQYIIYHQHAETKSIAENGKTEGSTLDTQPLDINLFNTEYLLSSDKIYRQATGRGQTYFFKHRHNDYVLRHYWRGGLIGKFNADFYFWSPLCDIHTSSERKLAQLKKTRAYREFELLTLLATLQLPAPKPVAARITSFAFGYRADIITKTISDSESLTQKMQHNLDNTLWFNIGKTIAQFHHHNIDHDDLNANNILIDSNETIFLIDFDKGKVNHSNGWKPKNIDRLLRSLHKEQSKNSDLQFNTGNWEKLLKGYKSV